MCCDAGAADGDKTGIAEAEEEEEVPGMSDTLRAKNLTVMLPVTSPSVSQLLELFYQQTHR